MNGAVFLVWLMEIEWNMVSIGPARRIMGLLGWDPTVWMKGSIKAIFECWHGHFILGNGDALPKFIPIKFRERKGNKKIN